MAPTPYLPKEARFLHQENAQLDQNAENDADVPNSIALSVCLRLLLVGDDLGVGIPRQEMRRYDAVQEGQEHHAGEGDTLDNRRLGVLFMIEVPRVPDHLPVDETGAQELCREEQYKQEGPGTP